MFTLTDMEQIESRRLNRKRNIYLFISVIIGLVLIAPENITWARDRENYLVYADASWIIMQRYLDKNIIALFVNEPLFLLINIFLSFVFSPDNVVRVIIFISTVGVLYGLGKMTNYNYWLLVLFFITPQILKNHVIHLRQGLALSFFLVGLVINNRYGKILKYSSVFIHTSFVFVVFVEFLEWFFKKMKYSLKKRILFSSIIMTLFILAIPTLATLLGDRRISIYDFSAAEGASGMGFIIWVIAGSFFVLVMEKRSNNILAVYGIILYLISYFFLDFAARIFENFIPIILVGVLSIKRKELRVIFILFFLLYGLLTWMSGGMSILVE